MIFTQDGYLEKSDIRSSEYLWRKPHLISNTALGPGNLYIYNVQVILNMFCVLKEGLL